MNIRCVDGLYRVRGPRRGCPDLHLASVRVDVVRVLFEGRPVERICALGQLTEVQRYSLYPPDCRCGENHRKNAANMARCLRLAPEVLQMADRADLPFRVILRLSAVCGDKVEATLQEQIEALQSLSFGGKVVAEEPFDGGDIAVESSRAAA